MFPAIFRNLGRVLHEELTTNNGLFCLARFPHTSASVSLPGDARAAPRLGRQIHSGTTIIFCMVLPRKRSGSGVSSSCRFRSLALKCRHGGVIKNTGTPGTRQGWDRSKLFDQMGIVTTAADEGPKWRAPGSVDIGSIVAAAALKTFYTYEGSVPVPPCSETVHYIVLEDEQLVHLDQVAALKELLTTHTGHFLKRPVVPRSAHGECRDITVQSLFYGARMYACEREGERGRGMRGRACPRPCILMSLSPCVHVCVNTCLCARMRAGVRATGQALLAYLRAFVRA